MGIADTGVSPVGSAVQLVIIAAAPSASLSDRTYQALFRRLTRSSNGIEIVLDGSLVFGYKRAVEAIAKTDFFGFFIAN